MKSFYLPTACFVCLAFASTASADVTLKMKNSGKGFGALAAGDSTQLVKGTKLRMDQTNDDGKTRTTIMDAAARQMIVLNHDKKEAELFDMTKLGDSLQKSGMGEIKASITPRSETRQIAGSTCTVYDIKMSVPVEKPMPMTMVMGGPYCLVKNGPGHADFAAFFKAAAESGFLFGDPRQAQAQPAQAKALTQLYRQMADLGVAFSTEMSISMEGEGPMAAIMKRMNTTMNSEVVSASTDAIPDSMFEIPAGYKVKK